MSKTSTKLVSIGLSVTTMVWLIGATLPVASADTLSDLLAQLQALQARITALQSAQGTMSSSYTFTKDLTLGSRGADVTALQQTLINGGYLKISAPTGYFGSMTKAALAAWQSANNISPAAGYFGPKSRAAFVVTTGTTGTTVTTTPGTGTSQMVTAPAAGLLVSLGSNNPTTGSLIAGAGRVPVLQVNLTAGNASAATVSQIVFRKTGVISDSNINGAYLVQSGKVVAQYNSLSSGAITFSGLNITVPAGQTYTYWLAIDVSSGVTAGNTVGFQLASANDINSTDASGNLIIEAGKFPVMGATFTASTVSNPSLATLSITSSTIGTTVFAGTQGNLVSAWTTSVGNNTVNLTSIKFKVVGSANKSDIQNVKLFVNGVQVGSTLPAVGSDGVAYFDLSSAPAALRTGTSNMQVYADVMGSPSFTYQFELLNTYDVYAVDTQYNTSLAPTINGGSGGQVTIQQGQTTMTLASNSPTGNVAKGQSNVTLAKFNVYAAGEAVKIKFLDFKITFTGYTGNNTLSQQIQNMKMLDDQGAQIGTTINQPSLTTGSGNTCSGPNWAAGLVSSSTWTDCFGTSASPINYIIPANTTRVVSLVADIQTGAAFTTIKGAIDSDSGKSNLQGLTSSQTTDTGSGVSGSALTLAANALSVAQNSSIGTQTVTKSTASVKIGSYALSASTAEGVTVNNISIKVGATAASNFQNLLLKVGSTQFGTTQSTLTNAQTYTFSGTPFVVPAGGTTIVDVYADVLSNASTNEQASTLSACTGSGAISFATISCTSTNGQTVNIGGAPALTVSIDNATAPATNMVMGSSNNPLATFRFQETTGNEAVKITDLNVFEATGSSTARAALGVLSLYNGSALVGTSNSGASSTNIATDTQGFGFIYKFHFATPVVVPSGNSVSLILQGNVPAWVTGGGNISDNATSSFMIATSSDSGNTTSSSIVTALGNSSSQTVAITVNASAGYTAAAAGKIMTFLRSTLAATTTGVPVSGVTTGRAKSTTDDVGSVTFTASAGGAVSLNYVKITVSGNLASTTSFGTATTDLRLFDPTTNAVIASSTTASTTCSASGACSFMFSMVGATSTPSATGYVISAGISKTFNIRIDSLSNTFKAGNGVSATFGASIAAGGATGDVVYTDATDGTGVVAGLPTNAVPVNISSVTYAQGT